MQVLKIVLALTLGGAAIGVSPAGAQTPKTRDQFVRDSVFAALKFQARGKLDTLNLAVQNDLRRQAGDIAVKIANDLQRKLDQSGLSGTANAMKSLMQQSQANARAQGAAAPAAAPDPASSCTGASCGGGSSAPPPPLPTSSCSGGSCGGGSAPAPAPVADQGVVRIQSANYPTYWFHVRGTEAWVDPKQPGEDMRDVEFQLVPGLADGSAVSFRSVAEPNKYLRHASFSLWLNDADGSALFSQDATFRMIPGMAGSGNSFEAVNYPGYFIRHQSFRLFLHQSDNTDLFRADATFIVNRVR